MGEGRSVPDRFIVTGMQGAGKTTLANQLATALGIPVLHLDLVKERLYADDVGHGIPARSSDGYSLLAAAAVTAMIDAGVHPIILEGLWSYPSVTASLAGRLGDYLEIHCRCPTEEAWRRFTARSGTRPAPHEDRSMPLAEFQGRVREMGSHLPLGSSGRLIEVDTSGNVDIDRLVSELHRATSDRGNASEDRMGRGPAV